MCCGGYSGWLKTNMVAFVSAGVGLGHKDEDHQGSVAATGVGRGRQKYILWPPGEA